MSPSLIAMENGLEVRAPVRCRAGRQERQTTSAIPVGRGSAAPRVSGLRRARIRPRNDWRGFSLTEARRSRLGGIARVQRRWKRLDEYQASPGLGSVGLSMASPACPRTRRHHANSASRRRASSCGGARGNVPTMVLRCLRVGGAYMSTCAHARRWGCSRVAGRRTGACSHRLPFFTMTMLLAVKIADGGAVVGMSGARRTRDAGLRGGPRRVRRQFPRQRGEAIAAALLAGAVLATARAHAPLRVRRMRRPGACAGRRLLLLTVTGTVDAGCRRCRRRRRGVACCAWSRLVPPRASLATARARLAGIRAQPSSASSTGGNGVACGCGGDGRALMSALRARRPRTNARRLAVAVLGRPHGALNFGGFDIEAWLFERGLRATGAVRPGASNVRLAGWAGDPRDLVDVVRERA